MPRHLALRLALLGTMAAGASAHAAQPTLSTTIPSVVSDHQAAFVSDLQAGSVMSLTVSLPLRHQALLNALLKEIYDPSSPRFRHYLSVTQFADLFGAASDDYAAAASFFAAQGLTVSGQTPNHVLMQVSGPVDVIERVFHVHMGLYRHPTENRIFMAPDRAPTLDLGIPVQEVIGLDDFVLPTAKFVQAARPATTRGVGSGPNGDFTGSDMHAAYYPSGTLTGAGQSVGLMELKAFSIDDVNLFFSKGYGPANSVQVVGVKTDSAPVTCTGVCNDGEQALDIEYAISIAPGLASVRVYVGNVAEDVLNAMASDNISKVLSTSWGWKENFATDDALFKEFAAQGQTNLTASGDYSSLKASGPWPEEDANIVAVGGTDVSTASAGGAWSAETGWRDSAGGPSLDKSIKIESYQLPFINAANGGSTTVRNVPDIAMNADTDMVLCAGGKCVGGYGGTSFASPMWAGIVALANQKTVAAGKPVVGFINPALYTLASRSRYTSLFHDEVKGKSGVFRCTKSYDLVTGLGSPKGQAFIDALIAD